MAPVIVRRKRDGKWMTRSEGRGRMVLWTATPSRVRSYGAAVAIIRADIGDDLADYEILPAPATHIHARNPALE
jgi:hypothetical protein